MIYNTILVGYIKLDHYWNDFLKRKVLIEFLKVSIDLMVRNWLHDYITDYMIPQASNSVWINLLYFTFLPTGEDVENM